jgi:hypothetical protein
MSSDWNLIDTLLGGTPAMRAAGKEYLPQHDAESNKNYANRLARATLLNVLEDTLDTLTGKPFTEDIVIGDDMPPAIAELLDDIDMQGTALQPFCRAWFREGWAKAFSHVLIDHPVRQEVFDSEGKPRARTLEDDRRDGHRPYWIRIRPENIIAAYDTVVNGRRRLYHVRILETTTELVGFEEVSVQRIRVLEPGTWTLWRKEKDTWRVESAGSTGLDQIPLVTFFAGKRIGPMEAKPPLADLAHLNIAHWQSSADQRNVLTVARFPILAGRGIDEDSKVDIGPNNFLTSSEGGEWYYVEHTGAAIEAGRKDLEALEHQMASYGSEFLRRRPGGETATARALDSAEAMSYLDATKLTFQDCVEEALMITAQWMGLETGGSIQLGGSQDDLAGAEAPELDALHKARTAKDISRKAYLAELKRRSVLADDFDAEADADELETEAPTDGLAGMFGEMPPAGAVPPAEEDE